MKPSLVSFFLFLSFQLSAVDNLRDCDVRSLGMGGNGVTQSVLMNPALLSRGMGKYVCVEYFNRYALKELGTVHAGFAYTNDVLPVGVDICSFGYDDYRESMLRLSVGKRLNDRWGIGMSVQYAFLQTKLMEEVPKTLSTDVGLVYSPVDKLLIGMLIMNFPSIKLSSHISEIKAFTGYSVQIGFQWEVINSLLIVGAVESNEEQVLAGNFGIEYRAFERFHIRSGINTASFLPAFGIGYGFSQFTVDVGATYHAILGVSTALGLKYSF